jgi:hypothetical protein
MEPQANNDQTESNSPLDTTSEKIGGTSSFDINQTPKPEPMTPVEQKPDIIPISSSVGSQPALNPGQVPVGDGPMTSYAPKPSVSEEMSRVSDGQSNEQIAPDLIVSKPKWYKSKKFIVALITVVAICILAGGSVLAYMWYQNPQKVVGDSLINALTAKTVLFTGDLNVSSRDVKANISISGGSTDATGKFDATLKLTTSGKTYTINGGVIYDNQGNAYFKVGGLAALATEIKTSMSIPKTSSTAIAIDKLVAKIDNKWIKISSDDLKQFSDDTAKTDKCMNDTVKKYKNDKTAIKEFVDLYNKNKFIAVEKELGQKDGSLGYEVKIDKSTMKSFAEGAKQTKIYKSLNGCDKSFTINALDISNQFTTDGTTTKLWSNMWSHQITKLEMNGSDDGTNTELSVLPKFNQTVVVKAPDSSISLSQLQTYIQELFTSFSSGTSINATVDETTQI